jgi:hypothetical protein
MTESKKKSWWNSANRWAYLKVGLIYFTTPNRVYEIAHKRSSANTHERMIRARLLDMGVLRNQNSSQSDSDRIDLNNGHI